MKNMSCLIVLIVVYLHPFEMNKYLMDTSFVP